ncbi:hypothetical protein Cri9333_4809 (plasmid) [Crinalium epipsammum PCC 9333]|uniref:Uncharacterized protein n=1 Tax=Crinalium epipsammum PCC 9333 TaxID=1173022 RepID=K9W5H0_9CYAN|nr:hypothetical protein [Crinalium epipsammum]AFZ15578.1 hypothetical protein Cri9333_4809 [Crinalium epipsammum PCC 9333]
MNNPTPLQELYTQELEALKDAPPVPLYIDKLTALAIINNIQLALKQPENKGWSAESGKAIALQLQELFSPNSAIYQVLEMGWNTEQKDLLSEVLSEVNELLIPPKEDLLEHPSFQAKLESELFEIEISKMSQAIISTYFKKSNSGVKDFTNNDDNTDNSNKPKLEKAQNKQCSLDSDLRINFLEERKYLYLKSIAPQNIKNADNWKQIYLFKGDDDYILTLLYQQYEQAFITKTRDITKATEAIRTMYEVLELSPPKIVFVNTPAAAFDYLLADYKRAIEQVTFSSESLEEWELILLKQLRPQLINQLNSEELRVAVADLVEQLIAGCLNYHLKKLILTPFGKDLSTKIEQRLLGRLKKKLLEQKPRLKWELEEYQPKDVTYHLLEKLQQKFVCNLDLEEMVRASLGSDLEERIWSQLWSEIVRQMDSFASIKLVSCIRTEVLLYKHGYWFDFFINELGCTYPRKTWESFQLLTEHCGWVFAFEELCIVCDRLSSQSLSK